MLTLECGVTLPGVCEDGRSSDCTRERERSPGRGSASQPGGSPDGPERRRRRPTVQVEGQATQEEFSSPMSPGISSHRGPGTVPVEQPQQAVPPGLVVVVMVEGLAPHLVMRIL